jgi:hypothetical protein
MPPWITFLTNEFFSVDWHGFSMVAWCAISYRLNCGLVFFSSTQIGKTQKIYHLHNKLTKMIKYTKQKKKKNMRKFVHILFTRAGKMEVFRGLKLNKFKSKKIGLLC